MNALKNNVIPNSTIKNKYTLEFNGNLLKVYPSSFYLLIENKNSTVFQYNYPVIIIDDELLLPFDQTLIVIQDLMHQDNPQKTIVKSPIDNPDSKEKRAEKKSSIKKNLEEKSGKSMIRMNNEEIPLDIPIKSKQISKNTKSKDAISDEDVEKYLNNEMEDEEFFDKYGSKNEKPKKSNTKKLKEIEKTIDEIETKDKILFDNERNKRKDIENSIDELAPIIDETFDYLLLDGSQEVRKYLKKNGDSTESSFSPDSYRLPKNLKRKLNSK